MRIVHVIVISATIGLVMASCGEDIERQQKRNDAFAKCNAWYQTFSILPSKYPAYCIEDGYCFKGEDGKLIEVNMQECNNLHPKKEGG